MGQYFYIVNATKNAVANEGKHYGKIGEFEIERETKTAIKKMGWDKQDKIDVTVDSGTNIKYQKFVVDEGDQETYGRDFAIKEKYGESKSNKDLRRMWKIIQGEEESDSADEERE